MTKKYRLYAAFSVFLLLQLSNFRADEVKWLRNIETKLGILMERQNLEGGVVARRVAVAAKKKKPAGPKRGRNSVVDKRKAPKTGSNRRQGAKKGK